MPGTVFLEGDKINLRTIEKEDIEFLRNGVNHPDVRVYMGNRRPQNLENEEDFFEEQICNEDAVHLLISRDEERIGIISLIPQGDKAGKTGRNRNLDTSRTPRQWIRNGSLSTDHRLHLQPTKLPQNLRQSIPRQ